MKSRCYAWVGLVFLVFSSCGTTENGETAFPSLDEVTIREIQESITSGNPFLALQDISSLKRVNREFSLTQLNRLYKDATVALFDLFRKAINQSDYRTALSIYYSAAVLGQESDLGEWNEQKILSEWALDLLAAENPTAALLVFRALLENGQPDPELLLNFASVAAETGSQGTLLKILSLLDVLNIEAPADVREATGSIPTPADMLKGTVTIWVNKGIRLEDGVGYPDRVIGSGFFIDRRGFLLTNYHVIQSEVDPEYEGFSRLYIRLADHGEERIPARVVGWDRVFDIALLKAEVEPEYTFALEPAHSYEPGERILAIGSPAGLESTVTSGIVSATGRRFLQMGDAMQVDVPINPGNSGGPLISDTGSLIGVVFAGIEQFEGINFAIPSEWIVYDIPDLYEGGSRVHSWLGLAVVETSKGLEVLYPVPGETSHRAGLLSGDILLSINNKPLSTIGAAQKMLLSLTPDTLVELSWSRSGEDQSGIFALGRRPDRPLDVALDRDYYINLLPPLFGMELEKSGKSLFEQIYRISKLYAGGIADESGLSIGDPLTIQQWTVEEELRVAILQIIVKKRKAGFLERAIQLASYLEIDNFI